MSMMNPKNRVKISPAGLSALLSSKTRTTTTSPRPRDAPKKLTRVLDPSGRQLTRQARLSPSDLSALLNRKIVTVPGSQPIARVFQTCSAESLMRRPPPAMTSPPAGLSALLHSKIVNVPGTDKPTGFKKLKPIASRLTVPERRLIVGKLRASRDASARDESQSFVPPRATHECGLCHARFLHLKNYVDHVRRFSSGKKCLRAAQVALRRRRR